jgi:predicted nuclease with TOPRIM domain
MVLQHPVENDYLCKNKSNQMKLEEKELKSLRELNSEFELLKVQLGELEIQKSSVLKRVDSIRVEFESLEKELIKKYGENSVINLEHGTVTQNGENK